MDPIEQETNFVRLNSKLMDFEDELIRKIKNIQYLRITNSRKQNDYGIVDPDEWMEDFERQVKRIREKTDMLDNLYWSFSRRVRESCENDQGEKT